jgi:hypothetical protein
MPQKIVRMDGWMDGHRVHPAPLSRAPSDKAQYGLSLFGNSVLDI